MAHTRNPGYMAGNHWNTCMRCGFDMRAEDSVLDGDDPSLIVCKKCYDPRHPQESIPARKEDTRPRGLSTGKIDNES